MLFVVKSSRGSIPFVLVLSAMFLALLLAGLTMSVNLQKQVKYTGSRDGIDQLQEGMSKLFVQTSLCSCHFNAAINAADAATIRVDTVASPTPDLHLTSVRSGCDFAGTANVVAAVGTTLPSGLSVNGITVTNLTQLNSGTIYTGNLSVQVSNPSAATPFRPVSVPIILSIDNTSGTPNSRPVSLCLPKSNSVVYSCPIGYSLVGRPGLRGTACMGNLHRGAANFYAAGVDCHSIVDPNLGNAQLCPTTYLTTACKRGGGVGGFGVWEWSSLISFPGLQPSPSIDFTAVGSSVGQGSCDALAFNDVNLVLNYRCCFLAR